MRTVLKNLSCLFVFLLIAQVVVGQGWERTFGDCIWGQDIVVADNGDVVGIANGGTCFNQSIGEKESHFFRYNEFGEQLIFKRVETNLRQEKNDFILRAITKANDGGYFSVGYSFDFVDSLNLEENQHPHIFRFSDSGDLLWEIMIDSVGEEVDFWDVKNTQDGYVIIGNNSNRLIVLKVDNSGEQLWYRKFEQFAHGYYTYVEADRNILVTGSSRYRGGDELGNPFFLKLDSDGNVLWEFIDVKSGFQIGRAIALSSDGGYFVGAQVMIPVDGSESVLYKFNNNGKLVWEKSPESLEGIGSIIGDVEENMDGSIWILNHTGGAALVKIDSLGNELFSNSFNSGISQFERAPDGGLYAVGNNNIPNVFLIKTDEVGNTVTSYISGTYSVDNENCLLDSTNIRWDGQIIEIENANQRSYARTDANGQYEIRVDTGKHVLKASPINDYWEICEDSILIEIDSFFSLDTADFFINKKVDCPYLKVNISAPWMRRCFDNVIHVNYCNEGTIAAENAYIDITLDERLTAINSTIPWVSQADNTFRFEVGDIEVADCGSFQITTSMDCDSVQLGQSLCMEAHIFPDSICIPIDSLTWDGSDLALKATCDGDSVRFEVINNGNTMTRSVDFIIIEDDMVMRQGSIPALPTAEKIKESVLAEGATYRMEVAQTEGHPWNSKVTAFIEACGTNAIGTFTTGFATAMPPSDNAPFFDTECVEVRGAYDPNDKEGFPKGVCNRRFVFNDTDLEYKIRFQNTGTDTAFKVEIRDTLSELLDPTTLQIVNASHAYDWNITGAGILIFTFENIMLPDSNVNEAASHGFIQYKIKQQADNLIDAEIENKAAIYFDFNAPIITNTTLHTVGDDFLTNQLGDLTIAGKITRPCGTPVDSVLVYLSDNCVTYTNEQGDYIFENIEANQDYVIRAERDDPVPKYLDILDMFRMRKIVLFQSPEPTLYDYSAGDVSGDIIGSLGGISTFDLALLSKVILGISNTFPAVNGSPWNFFNKDFSIDNPIPDIDRISLNSLTDNSFDNNFIAVKKGDLVSKKDFGNSSDTTYVKFSDDEVFVCDQQIAIEVDIESINLTSAGQFSIKWDETVLKLNEDSNGGVVNSLINGQANILYITKVHSDSVAKNLNFEMLFDVIGNVGSETTIELKSDGLEPIFLDGNEDLSPFRFSNTTIKIAASTPLFLNLITTPPTTSNSNNGQIVINNVSGGANSGAIEFNWSNGETGSSIDSLPPGEYMVTVTDQSTGCMTDTTIVLSAITSTNGLFLNENLQIRIAPNPTFNGKQASVQIKSNHLQNGKIEITDAFGRLIHLKHFKTRALEEIIQLESDLPPGIYLVSVFLDKEGMKTMKWVVD